jgi:hypothetical protein
MAYTPRKSRSSVSGEFVSCILERFKEHTAKIVDAGHLAVAPAYEPSKQQRDNILEKEML